MNKNKLKKYFDNNQGILKACDMINIGLTRYDIYKLNNEGQIERIKNGYYKLKNEDQSDAKIISHLYPNGILCMDTALFHYGYSDRTPNEWHIAINKDVSKSKFNIDYPRIKPHYLEPNMLNFGVTTTTLDGHQLNIYDRERVICDCFKYKNKIDSEMFNQAINAYVNDEKKNIITLIKYSKKLNVYKKMSTVMEVLINA